MFFMVGGILSKNKLFTEILTGVCLALPITSRFFSGRSLSKEKRLKPLPVEYFN